MFKEVVAKRYAKALFQVVQLEQSGEALDRTLKALQVVGQAFREHEYFRHALLSPAFDREVKVQVLKALLERMQVGGPVMEFLEYLVRKNRFQYLNEIGQAFAALVDEFQGTIKIPVTTAKESSREEQESMRRQMESLTGRKVQVQWSMNPALIGGMVVRVGEALLDGSVLGQLQAIRKRLVDQ